VATRRPGAVQGGGDGAVHHLLRGGGGTGAGLGAQRGDDLVRGPRDLRALTQMQHRLGQRGGGLGEGDRRREQGQQDEQATHRDPP
jgi:hypothetical protein